MDLSPAGLSAVDDIARRHGVSTEAVRAMLDAVLAGQGRLAQFDIPELGGMGQWMDGGMTMVGDMSNHGAKSKVGSICSELAGLLTGSDLTVSPSQENRVSDALSNTAWWPADLGLPTAAGSQNRLRYAWFAASRRLAVDDGGITVYDTGDNQIGGVSQQQGVEQTVSFASQHGLVRLANLPWSGGAGPTERANRRGSDSGPNFPAKGRAPLGACPRMIDSAIMIGGLRRGPG